MTLVAKRFNKYNNRFIKASRYIYSTPKYNANAVKVKTSIDAIRDKLSIQKTR